MNPPRLVLTVSTEKTGGAHRLVAELLAVGVDTDNSIVLHKFDASGPIGAPEFAHVELGRVFAAMSQLVMQHPGILAVQKITDGGALVLARQSAPDDNMALIRAVLKEARDD